MPDVSDRRTWLAALTVTGLAAALSDSIEAAQDPRAASRDALRSLRKVSDLLSEAGERLVLFEEKIGAFREPERHLAQLEFTDIQIKCTEIFALAEEYRLWLEGP